MRYGLAAFTILVHLFFGFSAWAEDELKVVATIKPIHSLVSMMTEGIENIQLDLLLDGNADPHHFALKPSQAKLLEEADVVFYAHPRNEVFLLKYMRNNPSKFFATFTELNGMGDRDHGWLSPEEALSSFPKIHTRLSTLTPKNSSLFFQNSENSQKRLKEKLKHWRQILHIQKRFLLADSTAFQPFAFAFNFPILAIPNSFLKALTTTAAGCAVVTHPPNKAAIRIAKQHHKSIIQLDLIGSDIPAGSGHYFTLMDRLVQQLSECLSSSPESDT